MDTKGCDYTVYVHEYQTLLNWSKPKGSAIARIIGSNVQSMQKFASTIKMWVFEETVNGRKLPEVINTDHENVKYLPGYKLPENVVREAKPCNVPQSHYHKKGSR
ncbi:UNVERIFIED_CONTAM: hypothetical protein FKN15_047932 [Acipenser sinensis]